jgi:hypothetical protein
MPSRLRLRLCLSAIALLAACHIEKRVPAGPVQEEETIRAVILRYYHGALNQDSAAVANAVSDSVQVVFERDGAWQHIHGAAAWARATARAAAVHVGEPSRIDIRQEDDLASAWVQERGATSARTSHLLLQRVGGNWQIGGIATVPSTSSR